MARSMTAYAREEVDAPWGRASWELRSVNHRYLEPSLRLPEEWRSLEGKVRDRLASSLKRGKVDCTLRFQPSIGHGGELTLNLALARQLVRAGNTLAGLMQADHATSRPTLPTGEILRWPGVIEPDAIDTDRLGSELLELLDRGIEELVASREREGAELARLIGERCDEVERIVTALKPAIPDIIAAQRERLRERLADLSRGLPSAGLDSGRLEQEMTLFAQKIDVSEELDRLQTHTAEVHRILTRSGPIGRRLDFLMQELNREANTLGSKSADVATTQASVDLKVLIEQMREQIQNLE